MTDEQLDLPEMPEEMRRRAEQGPPPAAPEDTQEMIEARLADLYARGARGRRG